MKKNLVQLAAGVTMCLALAGCFTVEKAGITSTGEEHVVVANYGWSLFNCIPLACGNASEDPTTDFALFRDDVTIEKLQARFDKIAGSRTVKYPHCRYYDTVFLTVLGIPIPYIICYKEISISGVLQ